MAAWAPGRRAQPLITVDFETQKFNAFLTRIMKGLTSEQAAGAILKLAMEAVKGFILKNPVDTGRSRAGWYVANNFIVSKLKAGSGYRRPSGAAQAEGMAQGRVQAHLRGNRKWIKITNAVQYARRLEYGWSQQAPYGMVRVTLQMLRGQVPKIIMKDLVTLWKNGGRPRYTHWRASASGPRV